MKRLLSLLIVGLIVSACDPNSELAPGSDEILGFWSIETVFLNGVNSDEYVVGLNDGTNHLHLMKDRTFARAYDNGSWSLAGRTLVLDRPESSGVVDDWKYEIIQRCGDKLVLETHLTEGQYRWGFDEFTDDEIIKIREVYRKLN